MLSPHAALIYTMVLVSAADGGMSDAELAAMGDMVRMLPAFRGWDRGLLLSTAQSCAELLEREDGLDEALTLIRAGLPEPLRETAYAIACDVAAADGAVTPEEARLLEMLQTRLGVDALAAAAIERAARARHRMV